MSTPTSDTIKKATKSRALKILAMTGKISWNVLDSIVAEESRGSLFDMSKLLAEAQKGQLNLANTMNFVINNAVKNGDNISVTTETRHESIKYKQCEADDGTPMAVQTKITNTTTKTINVAPTIAGEPKQQNSFTSSTSLKIGNKIGNNIGNNMNFTLRLWFASVCISSLIPQMAVTHPATAQ